jgi:hypothetical protein
MARHHAALPVVLAALAILLAGRALGADSIELPVPEAPTTILSTKLGSADVDFSLLGSWTAAASIGGGLLFFPGQGVQLNDAFPSLDQGFVFTQTPDITASLLILKRFFLNVSIIGSFANNFIQMGYRGGPNEALRSVILGNQGITIPASALMQIPEQPLGSLGVTSQIVTGGSTNDVLLRWDATLPRTKTFIGRNELVEQETGLNEYIRGMYFYLPDVGLDTGTLQVFIEDPNGTYVSTEAPFPRKYRLATFNDVVLDSVNGLVSLKNPVKGRVLVFYKKGGAPVGTTANGQFVDVSAGPPPTRNPNPPANNFSWGAQDNYVTPPQPMTIRQVTINGVGNTLLLWEPGDNSPFEIESSYAFSASPPADASKINIKLQAKIATATLPAYVIFQPDPPNKRFLVLRNASFRSTFFNFYPFQDPTGLIYGPNHDSISGGLDYDLFVQMMTPVSQFILEANIEPGSAQVTVNGIPETRFTVEPVSGTLTPQFDILPTDRIEVTYRKSEQGISGGDVLFAWRNQIPLSEDTSLSLAAGVRWNANPWSFSQEPYSKSGTVIATAGIDSKSENLQYSAQGGVSYTNPDTTGILRLFGMEGNSTQLDLSEDNWYPASEPVELGLGNRGLLYYRDYRSYGALGSSTLQTIEDSAPARMPYETGSRMGPYNVTGSDANLNATNLVFEYSLDAANKWVGAQVPVSAGSDVDLSNARAITIRYRSGTGPTSQSGTVNVYLQVGSVSEDLDNSGVLRAESSSADAGFPFADSDNSATLRVGAGPKLTGNGRLDSEDVDANGVLDQEDTNRVFSSAGVPVPDTDPTSWKNATFNLSDTDRQKLLRARSVRLVIAASGAAASGTIVLDSITVEGTPFSFVQQPPVPADRQIVHIQEVNESFAKKSASGGSLASRFSDTYRKFHPDNEPNQVLETWWETGVTSSFAVQGFVPQGTGGIQYQTVVSYIRADTANASYQFSLLDSSSKGIIWNVPAVYNDNKWHEVTVSRKDRTVTVDGNPAGSLVQFDENYGSLSQLKVTVSGSIFPTAEGHLYIDEIYLTDPQGVFGAAFVGSLAARFPGTILSAGKTPLLANVALRQDVDLYSGGFAALYGTPYAAEDLSSRSHAEGDLLFTRTSLDLALRDEGGSMSASGGHKVTVPNTSSPVTVMDSFSLSTNGGFTRENSVSITVGPLAALTLDAGASASPDESDYLGLLTQTWLTGLTLSPFPPFGITSSLSLSQALTGYSLGREWYGARWAREANLLVPWDGGGDVTRAEKLEVQAGIPPAPLGFTVGAGASANGSDYSSTGFTQASAGDLGLSLLMKLGPGDSADSVGVSYKRSVSLTTSPAPGPRFQQETSVLSQALSQQGYMLQAIPLVEIFSDNTGAVLPAWQGATQASYSPVITLSLQRSYGSRLSDLFVPSAFDLAVGQELDKNIDLVQATTYVRPKITTRAVNLFGQLGSTPRLSMVQTDEYSLSVSASVDRTTPALYPQYGPGPLLSQFSVQAYATLTAAEGNSLTLVEALRRDQTSSVVFSNDVQALLDWRVSPGAGVPLPLLPADIGATGHFEHRESAEATVGYQDTGTFHAFTFLLGHSTSMVYPGHGAIKASLNLGMDVEDLLSTGLAWRFAFRASIEAKLTF